MVSTFSPLVNTCQICFLQAFRSSKLASHALALWLRILSGPPPWRELTNLLLLDVSKIHGLLQPPLASTPAASQRLAINARTATTKLLEPRVLLSAPQLLLRDLARTRACCVLMRRRHGVNSSFFWLSTSFCCLPGSFILR